MDGTQRSVGAVSYTHLDVYKRQLLSTLSTYTEREQAVLKNRIERWAFAQPLESDPGVVWEDLGIDALFLDEAQNMKNLWPYLRGDGGKPPKYLGAIDRPSQRALEFAIRAYLVRRKNGGSGVFLLSATPAKNSPIEYFSLLSLVDGEAWTKLGITDSGIFVTRYLKIERKRVLDTDLTQTTREVVVGFVNIPELRDAINRLSEFRTAEAVSYTHLDVYKRQRVACGLDTTALQPVRQRATRWRPAKRLGC